MKKIIFFLLLSCQVFAQGKVTGLNRIHFSAATAPTSPTATTPPATNPVVTTPPASTTAAAVTRLSGTIPFDESSLWQLNSPAKPWTSTFTNTLTSTVENHYDQLYSEYDQYYEFAAGQNPSLTQIDYAVPYGGYGGREMKIYAQFANGSESLIWTMPTNGNRQQAMSQAITAVSPARLRFHIVNNGTPLYLRFVGSYTPVSATTLPARTLYPLKNQFGVVAFEWNALDASARKIDEASWARMKEFSGGIRHYLDWDKIEQNKGKFNFGPTPNGGWDYDVLYGRAKADGVPIYPCIKTVAAWQLATYPDSAFGMKDGKPDRHNEVPPVNYGSNLLDPVSYMYQARAGFQFAARYGSNTNIDRSLVLINEAPQGTYASAPVDSKKVGLGYVDRIECDNERDKWWKGRNGYQTGREFAANMSAFYDGHKNTMGAGVGVKNADPSIQVLMGGVASMDVDYVIEMIKWSIENRGYKADGTVNLPFDTYVYHKYIGNGGEQYSTTNTEGTNVEATDWLERYDRVRTAFQRYAGFVPPFVCNEFGYDINPGSDLNAPEIAGRTAKQVQGMLMLRQCMLMAALGQQSQQSYWFVDQGDNSNRFTTMGLTENETGRRPFGDYIVQVNSICGEYKFNIVSKAATGYALKGESGSNYVYALWMPTRNNSTGTYTLTLPGVTSITLSKPKDGQNVPTTSTLTSANGVFSVPIDEMPVFIKPTLATSAVVMPYDTILASADTTRNRVDTTAMQHVYLDTDTKLKAFFTSAQTNKYAVVKDATYVGEYKQTGSWDNVFMRPETKYGAVFSRDDYSTNLIFTDTHTVKRSCMSGFKFKSGYVTSALANPQVWSNELVSFAGFELRDCEIQGNANGNFNALNMVQYSTASHSGATSTDVWYRRLNIHDIGRAGIEILCQKYDGGPTLLSNMVFSGLTVQRTGLANSYGAGLSFSGSMKNLFVYANKFLENRFVGLEVVNAVNLIARSNEITSLTAVGSGVGISSDGNGGTQNLHFDGDTKVDVLGRGFYVYQGTAHFNGGTYKGRQRYDVKDITNSSFTNLNLTHWGSVAEYGFTFDGASNNSSFTNSTLTSAGAAAAGYFPFTRPIQLLPNTYKITMSGLTLVSGKKADGSYYGDGSILNNSTGVNAISPPTITLN